MMLTLIRFSARYDEIEKKFHYFHSIKEIWKATVGESSIFFQSVVVDTRSLISHFFLKTIKNSQLWVSALVVSKGKVQTSKIHCKKRLHNRITSSLFVCFFFFWKAVQKSYFVKIIMIILILFFQRFITRTDVA